MEKMELTFLLFAMWIKNCVTPSESLAHRRVKGYDIFRFFIEDTFGDAQ